MIVQVTEVATRAREAAKCAQCIVRFSKNLKRTCQGELKRASKVVAKVCVSELVGRSLNGGIHRGRGPLAPRVSRDETGGSGFQGEITSRRAAFFSHNCAHIYGTANGGGGGRKRSRSKRRTIQPALSFSLSEEEREKEKESGKSGERVWKKRRKGANTPPLVIAMSGGEAFESISPASPEEAELESTPALEAIVLEDEILPVFRLSLQGVSTALNRSRSSECLLKSSPPRLAEDDFDGCIARAVVAALRPLLEYPEKLFPQAPAQKGVQHSSLAKYPSKVTRTKVQGKKESALKIRSGVKPAAASEGVPPIAPRPRVTPSETLADKQDEWTVKIWNKKGCKEAIKAEA
ncbi:hypothetical protein KM043_016503 [Ampulex compressa]|nr:hypothetical protein KM043_016503 [Ampulex compressa]